VRVIGAGPAGLSAAYQLARLGHQVTIQDSNAAAGGMMRYGIPAYRLPRDVLDAEVKRILDLGVELKLNARVANVEKAMKDGGYDAVFMAAGAHTAKQVSFPTSGKTNILDAVSLLRGMELGEKPPFGKRVAIYGGGNTALDVARTALRMGAAGTTVIYRRNREKMPANAIEIEEALQEGVVIKWLSTIKKVDGKTITFEQMALDDCGYPQPTGTLGKMEADSIILAVGQDADLSLIGKDSGIDIENGMVKVDAGMMTGHPGIFAGGDMVPSARTVTTGIGHGKKAARQIDLWLRNVHEISTKTELASADRLNTWYYTSVAGTQRPELPIERRKTSFDEVQGGLSAEEALSEARRCLSCGNCFECDNCYAVCPDNAVKKLGEGKGFAFNYDYCKGCGICVAECPCGAIDMVAEDI
ncbi:MAG: NAD(P)-binding protein, partial [Alphaproteobacteria bacterium]|nr:NAD(P)-binding protein [Alphaproteobacteria bacterium]